VVTASRKCSNRYKITWPDYRSGNHTNHVRIFHHKTGEIVLQPLEDEGRQLYPELEVFLAELPRLGVAIVVTKGSRGRHGRMRWSMRRQRCARRVNAPGSVRMWLLMHVTAAE
jgi:hypothetical protein